MIIWHMLTKGEYYIWVRLALLARKFRSTALKVGMPPNLAKRGAAYDYNIPEKRAGEFVRVKKAKEMYADFTFRWRTKPFLRSLPEKMLKPA